MICIEVVSQTWVLTWVTHLSELVIFFRDGGTSGTSSRVMNGATVGGSSGGVIGLRGTGWGAGGMIRMRSG